MPILMEHQIAEYKDSFQTMVRWELKDLPFGIKTDFPRLYARELHHKLYLTVEGPDQAEGRVRQCFESAVRDGLVAVIATAFLGAGIGSTQAASAAFTASLTACLGDLAAGVNVRFDDKSDWTDWHPV